MKLFLGRLSSGVKNPANWIVGFIIFIVGASGLSLAITFTRYQQSKKYNAIILNKLHENGALVDKQNALISEAVLLRQENERRIAHLESLHNVEPIR